MVAFSNCHRKVEMDTSILDCKPVISHEDPYKIEFSLNQLSATQYEVVIQMILLDSNAFFGSPQSSDRINGAFSLDFGDTNHISIIGNLIESPVAELRTNEFGPRMIHEVHENTTYTQTIELKTKADFYMIGRVRFVIEPKCTLEEKHFSLKMTNGVLTLGTDPKC